MTRIIVRLWGYQVGPRIFKLRPFGHLFVEYVALGSKEESWIFRGGPEIIKRTDCLESCQFCEITEFGWIKYNRVKNANYVRSV